MEEPNVAREESSGNKGDRQGHANVPVELP